MREPQTLSRDKSALFRARDNIVLWYTHKSFQVVSLEKAGPLIGLPAIDTKLIDAVPEPHREIVISQINKAISKVHADRASIIEEANAVFQREMIDSYLIARVNQFLADKERELVLQGSNLTIRQTFWDHLLGPLSCGLFSE